MARFRRVLGGGVRWGLLLGAVAALFAALVPTSSGGSAVPSVWDGRWSLTIADGAIVLRYTPPLRTDLARWRVSEYVHWVRDPPRRSWWIEYDVLAQERWHRLSIPLWLVAASLATAAALVWWRRWRSRGREWAGDPVLLALLAACAGLLVLHAVWYLPRPMDRLPPGRAWHLHRGQLVMSSVGDRPPLESLENWLIASLLEAEVATTPRWSVGVHRVETAPGGWAACIPVWPLAIPLCLAAVVRWRLALRGRRGSCAACGYDLTGNLSGICPECGRSASTSSQDAPTLRAARALTPSRRDRTPAR